MLIKGGTHYSIADHNSFLIKVQNDVKIRNHFSKSRRGACIRGAYNLTLSSGYRYVGFITEWAYKRQFMVFCCSCFFFVRNCHRGKKLIHFTSLG